MKKYISNFEGCKKVIISTDDNPDYYFFMPIVAKMWSMIGYCPCFYVFGKTCEWEQKKKLIINNTLDFGGNVFIVDSEAIAADERFSGYELSMLSQLSRLIPSFMGIEDSQYCLTSDIDMLPINKDFFEQQDFKKDIHLFYANGYNHTRYAMCYIGMNASVWKSVVNVSKDNIYEELLMQLSGLSSNSDKYTQWNYDEIWFFKKIQKYKDYPKNCHMIDRKIIPNKGFREGMFGVPKLLPVGRLDRSHWVYGGNPKSLIDAHCKRPGYKESNWMEIRRLLNDIVVDSDIKLIDKYYKEFIENHE